MKQLYLLRLGLFITSLWALSTQFAFAQATFTSQANGNWSTGSTWVGGVAPGPLDKVVIQHTVTLTSGTTTIGGVTINAAGGLLQLAIPTLGQRTLTINGDFLQSAGDIRATAGGIHTIFITGNFTRNGGTYRRSLLSE